MASGIRFTKDERDVIRLALQATPTMSVPATRARDSALQKLSDSEAPKASEKAAGIGWVRAAAAMREVLGQGLALPPRPDVAWMSRMSNRIRGFGLTEADCRTIAKVAQGKRQRGYSFERLIWDADTLLAAAQQELPAPVGRPPEPEPILMEDL